ncbi:hypothetical protein LDENG_00018180 [Lucifuga dentata]|nr:hypothetical protein LDENG_00018180 [Lucifuga dentata]
MNAPSKLPTEKEERRKPLQLQILLCGWCVLLGGLICALVNIQTRRRTSFILPEEQTNLILLTAGRVWSIAEAKCQIKLSQPAPELV